MQYNCVNVQLVSSGQDNSVLTKSSSTFKLWVHVNSIDLGLTAHLCLMPQSHTHIRTLTENFGSNRSRPQKNEGGA